MPERASDEMELVLNDQLWRKKSIGQLRRALGGLVERAKEALFTLLALTLPNSMPVSPRQGIIANLSTVAMRKDGNSR